MRALKLTSLPLNFNISKWPAGCRYLPFLVIGLAFLVFSCKDNNRVHPDPVEFVWTFNAGSEGWSGDFADYPVDEEESYELIFEIDSLPEPLDHEQGALKLSGNNLNNDLFMFVKKRITGLDPNMVYYVTFTVEFATNEPGNETTASTAQGSRIYIGAGATPIEPVKIVDDNNHYSMNIGKCEQNKDGEDMMVLGNILNDTDDGTFVLKTLSNQKPFHRTTNEQGELWVIIAVDSGVEASTAIYFNTIKVELF